MTPADAAPIDLRDPPATARPRTSASGNGATDGPAGRAGGERLLARWSTACEAARLAPLAFVHAHTLAHHLAAGLATGDPPGGVPFRHLVELHREAEVSVEVADALGQLAVLRRLLLADRARAPSATDDVGDDARDGRTDDLIDDLIDECILATVLHVVEALEAQTLIDELTGLLNRRALGRVLPSALLHADRTQTQLAVAMVDVDHLKLVNDLHGHDAGDETLRQVAEASRSRLRAGDDVFRVGGDEFVLLLRGVGAELAAEILERGRRASAQPFSWGIATYPDDGEDGDALLRVADARLLASRAEARRR